LSYAADQIPAELLAYKNEMEKRRALSDMAKCRCIWPHELDTLRKRVQIAEEICKTFSPDTPNMALNNEYERLTQFSAEEAIIAELEHQLKEGFDMDFLSLLDELISENAAYVLLYGMRATDEVDFARNMAQLNICRKLYPLLAQGNFEEASRQLEAFNATGFPQEIFGANELYRLLAKRNPDVKDDAQADRIACGIWKLGVNLRYLKEDVKELEGFTGLKNFWAL